MAETDSPPKSQYFNLTYPLPYVAHVEINRPEKLNAFIEPYVTYSSLISDIFKWAYLKSFKPRLQTTTLFTVIIVKEWNY